MLRVINRCVKAPLRYIADLRAITFKDYLLISTNFSPSYPIMIFTALTFTLLYCALAIYFVFTSDSTQVCYKNVHGAAYLISILYPIQTILCFICLTGSIALSQSNCWKVILILIFGPVLCGFGYGQVGIIQLCLLSSFNDIFPIPEIMKQPGFIDALVYLYISFLALYFILMPSINYLYTRQISDSKIQKTKQQKQLEEDMKKQELKNPKTCCDRFICILYYFCNILFALAVIFILLIKILGPIIYTLVWIKVGANLNNLKTLLEKLMFAGLILAYFAPLGVMFITLAIQRLFKLGRNKKDGQKKADLQASQRSSWQPKVEIQSDLQSSRKSRMSSRISKSKISQKPVQISQGEKNGSVEDKQKQNRIGLL